MEDKSKEENTEEKKKKESMKESERTSQEIPAEIKSDDKKQVGIIVVAAAVVLLLAGGGYWYWSEFMQKEPVQVQEREVDFENSYTNEDYGFSFGYPDDMKVKERDEDNRDYQYLGLDVDFFVSLKQEIEKQDDDDSVAFFYAVSEGLSIDDFEKALNQSASAGEVQNREEMQIAGQTVTEIESSTAIGKTKTHYMFNNGGSTVIVSVFLDKVETFEPILKSMSVNN